MSDARKAPAFQFYADDFLSGTLDMSDAEVGVYIKLLCLQWTKGSISERQIKAAGEDIETVRSVIGEKFSKGSDGKYRNNRLEEVRRSGEEFAKRMSARGKAGAEARWSRDAQASPKHSPSIARTIKGPTPRGLADSGELVIDRGTSMVESNAVAKNTGENTDSRIGDDAQAMPKQCLSNAKGHAKPMLADGSPSPSPSPSTSASAEDCSEAASRPSDPPSVEDVFDPKTVKYPEFPTVAGRKRGSHVWRLTDEVCERLEEAFPAVDVQRESKRAYAWVMSHLNQRKTADGMEGFLFRWMKREQNSSERQGIGRPRVAGHGQKFDPNKGDDDVGF